MPLGPGGDCVSCEDPALPPCTLLGSANPSHCRRAALYFTGGGRICVPFAAG